MELQYRTAHYMSMEELNGGLQNLCNALYAPEAFGERMLRFIETFGRARPDAPQAQNGSGVIAIHRPRGLSARYGRASHGRGGRPHVEPCVGRGHTPAGDDCDCFSHAVPICAGAAHVCPRKLLGAAIGSTAGRASDEGRSGRRCVMADRNSWLRRGGHQTACS